MKVINDCSAYLSNYEVLEIMKEIKSDQNAWARSADFATVTFATMTYLKGTECAKQNPETIRNFLEAVKHFKLTKCEKLSLMNLYPKTELEIQLIIEDSEERLTEDEVSSLLEIIRKLDPEPEETDKGNEEAEDDES